MRISDIKDKDLRELAELRRGNSGLVFDNLIGCFEWDDTPEGGEFWASVDDGKITELPRKHDLKELVDTLEDTLNKLKALTIR
jgi:hypothetical protein